MSATPVFALNRDPMRQCILHKPKTLFARSSNKFISNSSKRKFTSLPAEHISDLVWNRRSSVTVARIFSWSRQGHSWYFCLTWWNKTFKPSQYLCTYNTRIQVWITKL